jgi:hypothetical protein
MHHVSRLKILSQDIFTPKRDEVSKQWKALHEEEVNVKVVPVPFKGKVYWRCGGIAPRIL